MSSKILLLTLALLFPQDTQLDLPVNFKPQAIDDQDRAEVVFVYGQAYETEAVIFLLDTSQSMSIFDRINVQRREVGRSISEMSENVYFSIIHYNSKIVRMSEKLLPATRDNKIVAYNFLGGSVAEGFTCFCDALLLALKTIAKTDMKVRSIIVTGDGVPQGCRHCDSDHDELLRLSLAVNPKKSIAVHTIFVGSRLIKGDDNGRIFLEELSQAHGGTHHSVEK
jgi:Mg-chelatase subunit ChlD